MLRRKKGKVKRNPETNNRERKLVGEIKSNVEKAKKFKNREVEVPNFEQ